MTPAAIGSAIPPSETVQWSAPAPRGLILRGSDAFVIPFSLVWTAGVSTIIPSVFRSTPDLSIATLIPLLFLCVGVYMLVGRFIADMVIRARTTYVVTDRAAYVAQPWFAGGTKRYGSATAADAVLIPRSNGFGTIRFVAIPMFGRSNSAQMVPSSTAFERIADAAHVYDLVLAASRS